MTKLSVNINKIATLRNTRPGLNIPDLPHLARIAIAAGAQGITIHPRPDQRHIRHEDVEVVAALVDSPGADIELNIEGNPFLGHYMSHARRVRPDQCTLVPDTPDAATSDHGWDLRADADRLRPIIAELRALGCRVSLFMDAGAQSLEIAADIGAHRIELYTGRYALDFAEGRGELSVQRYADTARQAIAAGLHINAGHDLNRQNLPLFLTRIPAVQEVSIGHALIADALEFGLARSVSMYLDVIRGAAG
jgi:pyridoxine 5-phosphate synthase